MPKQWHELVGTFARGLENQPLYLLNQKPQTKPDRLCKDFSRSLHLRRRQWVGKGVRSLFRSSISGKAPDPFFSPSYETLVWKNARPSRHVGDFAAVILRLQTLNRDCGARRYGCARDFRTFPVVLCSGGGRLVAAKNGRYVLLLRPIRTSSCGPYLAAGDSASSVHFRDRTVARAAAVGPARGEVPPLQPVCLGTGCDRLMSPNAHCQPRQQRRSAEAK
jgi:hypothetical protein